MATAGEVIERPENPLVKLHEQLEVRTPQFAAALPAHIPTERFKRVVLTAVQNNAALINADRQTFWNSAMRCAQDGLLPDNREAALVIFRTKKKDGNREYWVDAVQYLPMIAGLRKKVRNSGEIATWDAQVVHARDEFDYELGDDPFIKHKPCLDGDPGPVIAAYSVATLKSGEKSREVMTRSQIEKVRQFSRAKDKGPWVDWYEEMCRKTVARRHSKVLPMSTDLDDLIRRDDELYDFAGAKGEEPSPERPKLRDFMATQPQQIGAIPADDAATAEAGSETAPADEQSPQEESPSPEDPGIGDAREVGRADRKKGIPLKDYPQHWKSEGKQAWIDARAEAWHEADAEVKAKLKG